MFFWNVTDETSDEIHGRDCFLHMFFILMSVVMKRDQFTVIIIDAGGCNGRPTEITPDIFDDIFGVTFVGFCVNIETILMFRITFRFYFYCETLTSG